MIENNETKTVLVYPSLTPQKFISGVMSSTESEESDPVKTNMCDSKVETEEQNHKACCNRVL